MSYSNVFKMDVSSCLYTSSNVSLYPLKDDSNLAAFKTFEEIIRTCIGPSGKLKIIQNASGGHCTVTSASQKLLHIISIQNTFLKLIVSSTKTQLNQFNNFGLSCSFLTLKLINNSLSEPNFLSTKGKLFEVFGKMFTDFLTVKNNSCVFEVDLSSLIQVRSIVQAILQSKPGCLFRESDIHHFTCILLKAHLNCIPTSDSALYHKNITFITLEGTSCSESHLYEGLLIMLFNIGSKNINLHNRTGVKIILYTTSLAGDAEFPVDHVEIDAGVSLWDAILNYMRDVIKKVIGHGINILACQKVVHPSLKKLLEDANVLVLDRLGYEASKHLEYLSGSSNPSLFAEPVFGYLSCVEKVTIGRKDFLMLSNKARPFWTILICNFNEQAVSETKVVCEQVMDTLFRLLQKPIVCFGAGCTEVHTSQLVQQKVLATLEHIQQEIGCTASQILETLCIFRQSISDLATTIHQDSHLNFVTETTHGHLWRLKDGNFPSETDSCMCGQNFAADINESAWRFFQRSANAKIDDVANFHQQKKTEENIKSSVFLDELISKRNAYSLAIETASLLLRVSVSVHG